MLEYYVVTEDTLDMVAEKTGTQRTYFEREMQRGFDYNHTLVVFFEMGQWKELRIENHYNVAFVMNKYFEGKV